MLLNCCLHVFETVVAIIRHKIVFDDIVMALGVDHENSPGPRLSRAYPLSLQLDEVLSFLLGSPLSSFSDVILALSLATEPLLEGRHIRTAFSHRVNENMANLTMNVKSLLSWCISQ